MNVDLWEELWAQEDAAALISRLDGFLGRRPRAVDVFREFGAVRVCDAGCGYGALTVALASHGFEVYSFDVSPSAASLTSAALEHFGLDASRLKAADILSTGYPDAFFDGVVSNSVLDNMTIADAKRALAELRRVTKPGGVLMVSLDQPEEDDLSQPHEALPDGSLRCTSGRRRGMILHPYGAPEALRLLDGFEIVYTELSPRGEQLFVFKKPKRAGIH